MLALYMDCRTASSLHIGIWLQKNSPSVDRRVKKKIFIYIYSSLCYHRIPSGILSWFSLLFSQPEKTAAGHSIITQINSVS